MRIGIDISQVAYAGSGVARHVRNLVLEVMRQDKKNSYVLFGSSLRQLHVLKAFIAEAKAISPEIKSVLLPLPQSALRFLWNSLHIVPVEWMTGPLDVFWTSDWTSPPLASAKGVTTIHDLTVYRYPGQFDPVIVNVQKKRLEIAVRDYQIFFCDSETTKKDAQKYLGIDEKKLYVVYSGLTP